jgi:hypothetical protein
MRMTEVSMDVATSASQIFAVLADGWSYAGWVVGASHIREADNDWPAVGSRIHHSVGAWPAQISDVTTVRDVDPPFALELDARLWPFGTARVRFELTEAVPGTTRVTMEEVVERGPLALFPDALQSVLLMPRNKETLRRLADLAVRKEARQR